MMRRLAAASLLMTLRQAFFTAFYSEKNTRAVHALVATFAQGGIQTAACTGLHYRVSFTRAKPGRNLQPPVLDCTIV